MGSLLKGWPSLAASEPCGNWLNEQGHNTRQIRDWLGHKNIRRTGRYTANSPDAFMGFKFD